MSKIVVVGGTGLLGSELKKIDDSIFCTGSNHDIYSFTRLDAYLDFINPDIIINCAAVLSFHVDNHPQKAININVIGAANLAKYCIGLKKRLVFISSDYVYPGKNGNYRETDEILPYNKYAWTKVAGEATTQMVPDHLIIRTSFGASKFPYPVAYDNLFTSRDYVDVIAPMILDVATSSLQGIINIGTDRKSIAEFAHWRNVVPNSQIPEQKDFSFNLDKYKNYKTNQI